MITSDILLHRLEIQFIITEEISISGGHEILPFIVETVLKSGSLINIVLIHLLIFFDFCKIERGFFCTQLSSNCILHELLLYSE